METQAFFSRAKNRKAANTVLSLLATLLLTHAYMAGVWGDGISNVIFFEGFVGTIMIAVILAISRPKIGEYSRFYPRMMWGLALAHLFVALICVGAASLTGDASLIGPLIAYGVCGYVFSLIIWISAFNSEMLASPESRVSESSASNALFISLGPLLHFPVYFLVITFLFSEGLDSWVASIKNIEISFQVFTANIMYSVAMFLSIVSLNYLLASPRKVRINSQNSLAQFLLIYSLFTMLSFIGMLNTESDSQGLPQTVASIIFPFGAVHLIVVVLAFLRNQKASWRPPRGRDAVLIVTCAVIAYLSFVGLAPFEALVFALISGGILGGLLTYLSNLEANIKLRTAELEIEKAKSDGLLGNILPSYVISDLKERGASEPRYFDDISIMFTDFVGFTKMSASLSASELISQLNAIFTEFDVIVERHSSERIKTIGDAYMCVSGLTHSETSTAKNIVDIGFEMLRYLNEHNQKFDTVWEMRIGIASGDCVGGIVGEKKYLFDLFGDTVNMASRMESHSEPGSINIDRATYSALKTIDSLIFDKRPPTLVKGKGEVTMFFCKAV